jgi:hypothetical protein
MQPCSCTEICCADELLAHAKTKKPILSAVGLGKPAAFFVAILVG